MTWNKIFNPLTNSYVNIQSKTGKRILKLYLVNSISNDHLFGGADGADENDRETATGQPGTLAEPTVISQPLSGQPSTTSTGQLGTTIISQPLSGQPTTTATTTTSTGQPGTTTGQSTIETTQPGTTATGQPGTLAEPTVFSQPLSGQPSTTTTGTSEPVTPTTDDDEECCGDDDEDKPSKTPLTTTTETTTTTTGTAEPVTVPATVPTKPELVIKQTNVYNENLKKIKTESSGNLLISGVLDKLTTPVDSEFINDLTILDSNWKKMKKDIKFVRMIAKKLCKPDVKDQCEFKPHVMDTLGDSDAQKYSKIIMDISQFLDSDEFQKIDKELTDKNTKLQGTDPINQNELLVLSSQYNIWTSVLKKMLDKSLFETMEELNKPMMKLRIKKLTEYGKMLQRTYNQISDDHKTKLGTALKNLSEMKKLNENPDGLTPNEKYTNVHLYIQDELWKIIHTYRVIYAAKQGKTIDELNIDFKNGAKGTPPRIWHLWSELDILNSYALELANNKQLFEKKDQEAKKLRDEYEKRLRIIQGLESTGSMIEWEQDLRKEISYWAEQQAFLKSKFSIDVKKLPLYDLKFDASGNPTPAQPATETSKPVAATTDNDDDKCCGDDDGDTLATGQPVTVEQPSTTGTTGTTTATTTGTTTTGTTSTTGTATGATTNETGATTTGATTTGATTTGTGTGVTETEDEKRARIMKTNPLLQRLKTKKATATSETSTGTGTSSTSHDGSIPLFGDSTPGVPSGGKIMTVSGTQNKPFTLNQIKNMATSGKLSADQLQEIQYIQGLYAQGILTPSDTLAKMNKILLSQNQTRVQTKWLDQDELLRMKQLIRHLTPKQILKRIMSKQIQLRDLAQVMSPQQLLDVYGRKLKYKELAKMMSRELSPVMYKKWIEDNRPVGRVRTDIPELSPSARSRPAIDYNIYNEMNDHRLSVKDWHAAPNKLRLLEKEVFLVMSQEEIYKLQQAKRYVRTQMSNKLKKEIYHLNYDIEKLVKQIQGNLLTLKAIDKRANQKTGGKNV